MATQTIERTQQATQADLDRPSTPGQGDLFATGVEVYSPAKRDEQELENNKTQATMEAAVQLPAPMSGRRFIAMILRRVAAFDAWLSGPPQTETARILSAQVRARSDWTNFW